MPILELLPFVVQQLITRISICMLVISLIQRIWYVDNSNINHILNTVQLKLLRTLPLGKYALSGCLYSAIPGNISQWNIFLNVIGGNDLNFIGSYHKIVFSLVGCTNRCFPWWDGGQLECKGDPSWLLAEVSLGRPDKF